MNNKFPNWFGKVTQESKKIRSILKSHQSKCQFSEIGCTESRDHLDNNNSLHLNLLMNTLQNIKNEMEISKEKSSKNDNLINNLKSELILMKEENNSLKSQLKILETFNQNQETFNNQINIRLDGFQNNIDVLNNSVDKLNSKVIECAPFEYILEDFSTRRNMNECILTDIFLSDPNGYTMQLKIYPNGKGTDLNDNLTIEFGIVEGKYDDTLAWPMKRDVEIALINQDTNEIHVSQIFHFGNVKRRFKCTFFQPSERSEDDDNYFYGTRNLIDLYEMINNEDLCMNDSIVVKCFVD